VYIYSIIPSNEPLYIYSIIPSNEPSLNKHNSNIFLGYTPSALYDILDLQIRSLSIIAHG